MQLDLANDSKREYDMCKRICMSNRIHISRISTLPLLRLPSDAKTALIEAKNKLRSGHIFPEFDNQDDSRGGGPPLPKLSVGCVYYEVRVGTAHPDDDRPAGRKRLVLEYHDASREIREIYYTEEHYQKFSFYRVC